MGSRVLKVAVCSVCRADWGYNGYQVRAVVARSSRGLSEFNSGNPETPVSHDLIQQVLPRTV